MKELAEPQPAYDNHSWTVMREAQIVSVLPVLIVAEQRITPSELSLLEALVEALPEPLGLHNHIQFGLIFWAQIARATRNPFWEAQVIQQGVMFRERSRNCPQNNQPDSRPLALATYRALVRALRTRTVSTFWLEVI